jgi:hypothetical protein
MTEQECDERDALEAAVREARRHKDRTQMAKGWECAIQASIDLKDAQIALLTWEIAHKPETA